MRGSLLLLSTCGTSVFTNKADAEQRKWLNENSNRPVLAGTDGLRLESCVSECQNRLGNAGRDESRLLSAELNGVHGVLDKWPCGRVQHLLVHSDTAVGRAAAEIVKLGLEKEHPGVQLLSANGLRTDDLGSFRAALSDLTQQIETWTRGTGTYDQIIFNLTGGFKSVNAYLQAFGMVYADRCVFLFEGANQLMEIPRLPLSLDDFECTREHSSFFRRNALGYALKLEDAVGIADSLILLDDGSATTSVWGDVVWSRHRKRLFGERLLEPLSPKLGLANGVRKTFDQLPVDRRIETNEALDQLSGYLDGVRPLLKSNTFKQLSGKDHLPSTHEMYLWNDRGAWRLLGHYEEGGRFLADLIGPHL